MCVCAMCVCRRTLAYYLITAVAPSFEADGLRFRVGRVVCVCGGCDDDPDRDDICDVWEPEELARDFLTLPVESRGGGRGVVREWAGKDKRVGESRGEGDRGVGREWALPLNAVTSPNRFTHAALAVSPASKVEFPSAISIAVSTK